MTADEIAFEALKIAKYSLYVNIVNVVIVGLTAFFVWWQLTTNYSWNRRKTTQEILNTLTTGDFPALRHELEKTYNIWDNNHNYQLAIDGMQPVDVTKLNHCLNRILNYLETVTMHIKNNIIDEDIIYDYLGWILTQYSRWAMPYIEERRKRAGNAGVLSDITFYAKKWEQRMKNEDGVEKANSPRECTK